MCVFQKSSICRAAIHAGVIQNESGGYVDVMPVDRRKQYGGSSQNGVTSERYGFKGHGGTFQQAGFIRASQVLRLKQVPEQRSSRIQEGIRDSSLPLTNQQTERNSPDPGLSMACLLNAGSLHRGPFPVMDGAAMW